MLGRADTVSMEAGITLTWETVVDAPVFCWLVMAAVPSSIFTCHSEWNLYLIKPSFQDKTNHQCMS